MGGRVHHPTKLLTHYSRRHFVQLATLSTLLAACRPPREHDALTQNVVDLSPEFQWQRWRGQEVSVLLNDHPWTAGVKPYLADFEALTGIRVKLEMVPEPGYFDFMETMLRQSPVPADVFFLPMDSTAYRLWQDNLLQPLTPLINNRQFTESSYNLIDFPEGFRFAAMYPPAQPAQQLFGMPATFEAYILFYNKQLVNRYLDGQVPRTMTELIEAAQTINQIGNGDFFGAVMRGVRSDAIIDTVTGLLLNCWGPEPTPLPHNLWFDGDWQQPRFTDARVVAGLAAYAQLMQAGPPHVKEIDWPQATQLFQSGQAAFYIDASLFGPSYETSAIAGQVGYTVLPRSQAASWTGHWLWGLGMAQQSPRRDAAWLFIQWAISPKMEPQIAMTTGGAPRFSSWLTPSAYTEAMNIDYALAVQTAMQTSRPTVVLHPQWPQVAIAIATAIQPIYDGTAAPVAAAELQHHVIQIMQEAA